MIQFWPFVTCPGLTWPTRPCSRASVGGRYRAISQRCAQQVARYRAICAQGASLRGLYRAIHHPPQPFATAQSSHMLQPPLPRNIEPACQKANREIPRDFRTETLEAKPLSFDRPRGRAIRELHVISRLRQQALMGKLELRDSKQASFSTRG